MDFGVMKAIEGERVLLALLGEYVAVLARAMGVEAKAGYKPSQPRAPRGAPNGGQWVGVGGGVFSGGVGDDGLVGGRGKDRLKIPDSWKRPEKFDRHYKDHAVKDFGDITREQYAESAKRFRRHAERNKLPAVVTVDGYVKYYDPKTNRFGVYHPRGKTETFFKPSGRDYFEDLIKDELSRGGKILNPYKAPSGIVYRPSTRFPGGSITKVPLPTGGFGNPPKPGRARPFNLDDFIIY